MLRNTDYTQAGEDLFLEAIPIVSFSGALGIAAFLYAAIIPSSSPPPCKG